MNTVTLEQAYAAAHDGAVFVDRSNLGMLKITGSTRFDLIHRMSTQDLRGMQSGEGRVTILTTDIGRIIDRLHLYASSDTLYALTSENLGDPIARYLMRYVFFNDDFHMEDVTSKTAIFGVYGSQADQLLAKAGFPETDLPLHHWRQAEIEGMTVYLHRTDAVAGNGYFVMCAADAAGQAAELLSGAGIVPIDDAAFDYLRVESQVPRYGHELGENYIPLEANLWDDVSFAKGCYIGQEIIARMESRGKLAKKLVAFSAETPISTTTDILANGKKAGSLTSVASGAAGTFAMGYVRTKVLDSAEARPLTADGVELTLLDSADNE